VSWPTDTTGAKVTMRARTVDASSQGVSGVKVSACGKLDISCNVVVASATSDTNGLFEIKLPRAFDGYLMLDGGATHMPALVFALPLYADFDTTSQPYTIVTPNDLDLLLGIVGKSLDATAGHLGVLSSDCQSSFAAGVALDVSVRGPNTVAYYYKGSLPDTSPLATDSSGVGGFVNMPPGSVTVGGRNQLGQLFGQRTVFVRKGTFTFLQLGPSP
jgi:hypothetical protein